MGREILFRGKCTGDGEWVYGSLHTEWGEATKDGNRNIDYRILGMRGECEYVDPETVGQFTGLLDKSGTKIFEDDVVIIHSHSIDEEDGVAIIEWDEEDARFVFTWGCLVADFDNFYAYEIEVIDNIHDNPESPECEVTNER